MKFQDLKDFYCGKTVLITGHTGFKGSWMCNVLVLCGANVIGYSLNPPTDPNLYQICGINNKIKSYIGDIRDKSKLAKVFACEKPEIVIHMAAQPLVIESYKNPSYTYEVNVMGTVNVLECIRNFSSVKSFVNVTTDKVYRNDENNKEFTEQDYLDGFDPYSNSKSCSELVTACYKRSFFDNDHKVAISTCRAGNVIGGGDFSDNRIIPDCVRAVLDGKNIKVRNPYSVRPYQYVLEPVVAYLLLAMEQTKNYSVSGNYNIGPRNDDIYNTGELVNLFVDKWNKNHMDYPVRREDIEYNGPREAGYLRLDSSKFINTLGWESKWNIDVAIEKIIEWTDAYQSNEDMFAVMRNQIISYFD